MPKDFEDKIPFIGHLGSKSLLRNLLTREKILPTFRAFREFIDKQGECDGVEKNIAFLIQKIIVNRIRQIKPDTELRTTPNLRARIKYFASPSFIKNFSNEIPFGKDTSYSVWFNNIFGVKFTGWREEMLIKRSNTSQCNETIGDKDKKCYLCGIDLVNGNEYQPKHCEHVLPLFAAIGHLWLTFNRITTYSVEEIETLKKEYAWSHECCNLVKKNTEFIKINRDGNGYELDGDGLTKYYTELQTSKSFDCPKLQPQPPMQGIRSKVETRLQGILAIINKNIQNFGGLDTYHLFIKLKILSAFTNTTFLKILTGEDGELVRVNIQTPEQKRKKQEAREALENDIEMDELDFHIKRQIPGIRRALRGKVPEKRMKAAVAKELKRRFGGLPFRSFRSGFRRLQYGGVTTLNKLAKNPTRLTTSENPTRSHSQENPTTSHSQENPTRLTRAGNHTTSHSQENPTTSHSQENPTTLTEEEDLNELTFPREFLEMIGMPVKEISSMKQLDKLYLNLMVYILTADSNITRKEIIEVTEITGSKLSKSRLTATNELNELDIESSLISLKSRSTPRSRQSLPQRYTRKLKHSNSPIKSAPL